MLGIVMLDWALLFLGILAFRLPEQKRPFSTLYSFFVSTSRSDVAPFSWSARR
jgi:hypothetical protein